MIMRWILVCILLLHLFSAFVVSKDGFTLIRSKRFSFSPSCEAMHQPCKYHYDCCPPFRCSFIDETCQPRGK